MIKNKAKRALLILFGISVLTVPVLADSYIDHASGIYSQDIFIAINNFSGNDKIFYSFGNNENMPSNPYTGGLLLSALPGEEREYIFNLSIGNERYTYNYLIDKRPPEKPVPELIDNENGYGYIFTNPSDKEIYYGFEDYNKGEKYKWSSEVISPPKSGFIYYFAIDSAGNESETGMIYPVEDNETSGRVVLNIKSPVEGEFSNTQLLFIDKGKFEWIKYTLNGEDPVGSGVKYTVPVEIRRYGNVNLKVSAKLADSGKIITKEINYRVNTKAPLKNIPPSGIYSGSINIKSSLAGYRYSIEDRLPGSEDPVFEGELNINPVYGGVKYTTIRLKKTDEEDSDFRYFYVIDDRIPAVPIIDFYSRLPNENIVDVKISGPEYADIFYTTDGSSPGKSSLKYDSEFSLSVPEDKNAGSIIVKARAVSLNGKSGEIVSSFITYDTKEPDVPDVSINKDENDGLYKISYNLESGDKLYYRLEDSINGFYPVENDNFFLDIPEGCSREFRFIFAAVDSAGNWSDFTDVVQIKINKLIPEAPEVNLIENKIIIESEYHVVYKYTAIFNGKVFAEESGSYLDKIDLTEIIVPGSSLKLNLIITDESGNILETENDFYFPVAEEKKEAVLFSKKPENIYTGSEVEFFAYPDGIEDKLYYYLTEKKTDGENITEGPFETDGNIIVPGKENRRIDYFLEIFSINEMSGIKSQVNTYNFTIDNEKPALPVLKGIENGAVVNSKVILTAESDGDSVIFMNYANDPDKIGTLFSKSSIIFNKPIIFDSPVGKSRSFYLITGAGDSAGNSSVNDNVFSFTIDKTPPVINDIIVENEKVVFKGEENLKYYYETGFKGTSVRTPDLESDYFTESFEFNRTEDDENIYILKVVPYDQVGNKITYPYSFMFRIDNKKPKAPEEPLVTVNEKSRKVYLSWDKTQNNIIYTLNNESNEYKHPFSIKYSSDITEMKITYHSVDSAGNESDDKLLVINLPGISNTELVTGINNNSFYRTDLELKSVKPGSLIRYEISTEQIFPPEVTVFSPELPEKLPFKIEDGESINFIVSMKEFRDRNDKKGGAEQVLRFTIDKQLPEPPEISGINDGEYYLNDCTAFFKPCEDDIFYSVSSYIGSQEIYEKYSDAFKIESPEGTYKSFVINAYTQDYAGNKSSIKSWEITIDKEIIYVSKNGKDYYTGTRSWPYKSINKAIEQIKNSDRKTIFIEEGQYNLNSPAVVDEAVSIYGGFKEGSWQDKSGSTVITVDKSFPADNPAFYIYGGNLTLDNINILNEESIKNNLFVVNKGNLSLINSRIELKLSKGISFIKQNYGKLTLSNIELSGYGSDVPVVDSNYGVVNINNCGIKFGSEFSQSTILEIDNSSDYSLTSTEINAEKGKNITAIGIKNSSVNIKNTVINCSDIGMSFTGIESVDSKLSMQYSKIISSKNIRLYRSIVSEDSILDIKANNFNIGSVSGVIGFKITGGTSFFANNRIKIGSVKDFIYVYLLEKGMHSIETNIFQIGESDEIINIRAKNSSVDYLNNTVTTESAKNGIIMFKPEDNSINRIINNIIINYKSYGKNNMIYNSYENSMISFKNNCVYGCDIYLDGLIKAQDIISLDLVDGIYSAGRFSGNIEESPDKVFAGTDAYSLSSESECIDAGYDLKNIIKNNTDIDGDIRPNRGLNSNPAYDIGADEFYN